MLPFGDSVGTLLLSLAQPTGNQDLVNGMNDAITCGHVGNDDVGRDGVVLALYSDTSCAVGDGNRLAKQGGWRDGPNGQITGQESPLDDVVQEHVSHLVGRQRGQ